MLIHTSSLLSSEVELLQSVAALSAAIVVLRQHRSLG
jgi:hypothetical protein